MSDDVQKNDNGDGPEPDEDKIFGYGCMMILGVIWLLIALAYVLGRCSR